LWKEEPLPIPVLALRAGRQQPPNDEAYLKTLFPRLQYKFLPGLSHFLMMEAPAQVNTEIHEFLKGRKLQ
jgi:pimeloyl-ACP methyl ester carboxylesterase